MATIWLDADVPALVRLARMIDLANTGAANGVMLSEIRQLEDRFGLSSRSRRLLQWETGAAGDGPPAGENDPNVVVDMERWARASKGEDKT
jgi:hypothetical protein